MAQVKEFPMTADEYDSLREKLDFLKNDRRKEIAERIAVARGYGDLSENAEYDAAKEEQAHNEEEIKTTEERIKFAVVVSEDKIDDSIVGIGVNVRVQDASLKQEIEYSISGSIAADPLHNKISNESPIAMALMGRKVGDKVVADTPGGPIKMKILAIERKK